MFHHTEIAGTHVHPWRSRRRAKSGVAGELLDDKTDDGLRPPRPHQDPEATTNGATKDSTRLIMYLER